MHRSQESTPNKENLWGIGVLGNFRAHKETASSSGGCGGGGRSVGYKDEPGLKICYINNPGLLFKILWEIISLTNVNPN